MSDERPGGPLSYERWPQSGLSDDASSFIVTRLVDMMVGVKASEVISIEYERSAVAPEGRTREHSAGDSLLDLCQLFGSRWPADGPARCTLLVWSGVDRLRLLAGDGARVVSVPKKQLSPLPALLAGLRSRAGVSALLLADRQLGLVVDNNLLGRISEGSPSEQGQPP